jgi:nucleotide-binding universal stress UspA family protein
MKRILVCVDFSDVTERVLSESARMASALNANIHLVHSVPGDSDVIMFSPGAMPYISATATARDTSTQTAQLKACAQKLRRMGVQTYEELLEGPTVEKIIEEAERLDADRIVIGSHGHGAFYQLIVGSVTEGVLRRSRRPVLVVPSQV